MNNRYRNTVKTVDENGKPKYQTTLYPTIPEYDSDVWIYTSIGNRLDTLANKYYQDPTLWWVIARANNIGKGTLYIDAGTRLRIPMELNDIMFLLEQTQTSR